MRRSAGLAVIFALLASVVTIAQVYNVGDTGVTPPKVVKKVEAQYPDGPLNPVEGDVGLTAVISASGIIGAVDVTKALDPDLDPAAVDALIKWEFEPGTKDGKPVDVRMDFVIHFAHK